jgi:hypothetical protein
MAERKKVLRPDAACRAVIARLIALSIALPIAVVYRAVGRASARLFAFLSKLPPCSDIQNPHSAYDSIALIQAPKKRRPTVVTTPPSV